MGSFTNVSYAFIPFSFEKGISFQNLAQEIRNSEKWECVEDDLKYMLKYISDKFKTDDPEKCQCFHFRFKESIAKNNEYKFSKTNYSGEEVEYKFNINGAELFCFSTRVCVLALEITFPDADAKTISSAQYYLKKVSRQTISCEGRTTTLLELSKNLVSSFEGYKQFDFFFFSNSQRERANFFTCIEQESLDNYKEDLFFLKRCYNDEFLYTADEETEKKEIFRSSEDIAWGITSEAVACITSPAEIRRNFFDTTFYRNFKNLYFFMYVFLLHQKYVLYLFLSEIGIGTYNDLETLEGYKDRLYEFETDFVFSCITEVPQYQNLYDRISEAFNLKNMYKDVHEPLLALSDVRRTSSEKSEKKKDSLVNAFLFILSILSVISVIADAYSFIPVLLEERCSDSAIFIWQLIITGVIVAFPAIFCAIVFSKSKKR